MTGSRPLSSIFLEHTRGKAPGALETVEELEKKLQGELARGRAAWSKLSLDGPVFMRHLAERMEEGEDCASGLDALRIPDLYLACSCLHRASGAIELFERRVMAHVSSALAPYCRSEAELDDVLQDLRERLFVSAGAAEPKLATYRGRGSLLGYVKIAGVWIARTRHRRWDNRVEGDGDHADRVRGTDRDLTAQVLSANPSEEMDFFVHWHRDEFGAAFVDAMSSLTAAQRNLLRLHYFDKLTETAIAGLEGVHKGTISRRLREIQKAILDETQRLLQERLHLRESEFKSLAAAVRSKLGVSILRLLGKGSHDK